MSRLGKNPISIPAKTEVSLSGRTIMVKGPLGELKRDFRDEVEISIENNEIKLVPTKETKLAMALWGTYAAEIKNMISGVQKGFEKVLIVEGVGYKFEMSGNKLVLSLGFSHKINLDIPEGLKVAIEKNVMKITGPDKEKVGQFAAKVRALKKPEPYKGKGIHYSTEVVRRKEGKKSA